MEIQGSRGKCQGHGGTQSVFFLWLTSFHHLHDTWWGPSVRYRVPGQKRAPWGKEWQRRAFELGAALWATKVWRGLINWVPKGLATPPDTVGTKLSKPWRWKPSCIWPQEYIEQMLHTRNCDMLMRFSSFFFGLCSVTLSCPTLLWPHRL